RLAVGKAATNRPALEGSEDWLIAAMLPTRPAPFDALVSSLVHAAGADHIDPGAESKRLRVAPEDSALFASLLERLLASRPPEAQSLLILDQMEELFTPACAGEVAPFRRLLQTATTKIPRFRVIATVRSDFYPRLERDPWLQPLLNRAAGHYSVGQPGALALERTATKEQVLDAYLHLAPFGGNLEGVRAASLAWLNREPGRLTPAQAALLVALPQAPEQRRPDRYPEAARRGRDRVLARAEALGLIDADTAIAARREPIPTQRQAFPMLAPHLARRALALSPNAHTHRLTLDADLQASLQRLATEHATRLPDAVSIALLVADHGSGEVLASVGSAGLLEHERGGFVDMTRALRSPGSTLKPLIYGLAFELGLAHPESLIDDRPRAFGGYVPENFDRGFQGTLTVRAALQQSSNVPAVTLLEQVGPARLLARLHRAGAQPRLPDSAADTGLAIGLGGIGLSLTDLVRVYAAIARGGEPVTLNDGLQPSVDLVGRSSLVRSTRSVGRAGASAERRSVLSPRAAWYLASILSGAERLDQVGGVVAFKTGTSYGYRDAWALGFDGKHVIGVWTGRPDGAAVPGLTGTEAAVPILRDALARLDSRVALPGPPPGVLMVSSAELPVPLRRVGGSASGVSADRLEIAFPPDGAVVDLGLELGMGGGAQLALKVRNGSPPFQWLANGKPILNEPYARSTYWRPEGPGFATIAVIDARGQSSRVGISLR
ncbi:transglycosylase domain-containing protein, partial [Halochromatium sp.]